ncbi:uncharacterized protein TNCV_399981 [Trichonephila clavipes]|nr:uncharacterized protein TNCV_399981 [Trichonephila clavipes]
MADEQLARHHMPVTTVYELWHRVEAAWAYLPVHVMQFLFDSIPRRLRAAIPARGGCSGYWFLRIYAPKFLENLVTYNLEKYHFVISFSFWCSNFNGQ